MILSLLYQTPEALGESASIYDLSVDKTVKRICKSSRRCDYFLKILQSPLRKTENIEYRREIIADFENNENLAEQLRLAVTRYDKLKSDWLEMKSGASVSSFDVSNDVLLEQVYSSLKVTAMFPNTVVSLYRTISDVLSGAEIKSRGLSGIKKHCDNMLENEYFSDVCKVASNFLYNSAKDYDFEIIASFDDCLCSIEPSVCGINPYRPKKKNSFFGLKRSKDEKHPHSLNSSSSDEAKGILCQALIHTDELLYKITESVYESLYGISYEMDFYLVALDICDFIKNTGYEYCYPTLTDEPVLCANGLRDIYLASDEETPVVFPVDVSMRSEKSSLIVTGGNGSGKTTFLRAVGALQLFAQAGLPTLCKDAIISARSGIFTHFSSKEEEFRQNDRSGRFESEVSKVAQIINSVTPNSLILLNETFQTTSYREGSDAIINILKALSKIGAQYIFVTHLPGVALALSGEAKSLSAQCENGRFKIK
ncbi:MAG: hypothetical protein PUB34_04155 [Clostridia bacterium]|nr:hypothetical protein [Clostridia bacterium]